MRCLHEQLSTEYETLKTEQESLKKVTRDLRSEIRTLKETNTSQQEKIVSLESERDGFKNDAKNLGILRAEHSKLKVFLFFCKILNGSTFFFVAGRLSKFIHCQ